MSLHAKINIFKTDLCVTMPCPRRAACHHPISYLTFLCCRNLFSQSSSYSVNNFGLIPRSINILDKICVNAREVFVRCFLELLPLQIFLKYFSHKGYLRIVQNSVLFLFVIFCSIYMKHLLFALGYLQ